MPLALTMGEPAGIGAEIAMKAWLARDEATVPPFLLLDDPDRLVALAGAAGWDVPVRPVSAADEAMHLFPTALPVLPVALRAAVVPGRPDPVNGPAVLESIDRAVALTLEGVTAAVVTNPIQKSALYAAGFRWPGHTEYLAHLANLADAPVMMLEGGGLRVTLVTIHVPLREVPFVLTADGILHTARVTADALRRDFGIARPRLAVAALNPHAGEAGSIGGEEIGLIGPAVAQLRTEGMDVSGPLPSDTLFHAGARARYDAVVCMYHDQALIPLKTLDFETGVNITLGLPFVRTSPDHGTALDIAGQGIAGASSLIAALKTARRMADRREEMAA